MKSLLRGSRPDLQQDYPPSLFDTDPVLQSSFPPTTCESSTEVNVRIVSRDSRMRLAGRLGRRLAR
jgi:hypothetical protein